MRLILETWRYFINSSWPRIRNLLKITQALILIIMIQSCHNFARHSSSVVVAYVIIVSWPDNYDLFYVWATSIFAWFGLWAHKPCEMGLYCEWQETWFWEEVILYWTGSTKQSGWHIAEDILKGIITENFCIVIQFLLKIGPGWNGFHG